MNDDLIADLKQFITATIGQQLAGLATADDVNALRSEMATKADIARLERKIDNLQEAVAEAIDNSNDAAGTQLRDHEQRISRLEQASSD